MNIFVLDKNPHTAAYYHCDKHVVKMPLETAQMCSTALHYMANDLGITTDGLYKPAYDNHPMTKWVRETKENLAWAVTHGLALCHEYTARYSRVHASQAVLLNCARPISHEMDTCQYLDHTTPPQCMPDEFKCSNYIKAYRNYYRVAKAHIHKWTRAQPPAWL